MTRDQLAMILAEENATTSCLDVLNNREVEVISLLSQGYNSNNICRELQITLEQLSDLKQGIRLKCNLNNDVQLLQFACRQRSSI